MTSVLVVEDSPTQAAEIALVLEDAGYLPTVVDSGQVALDAIRGTTFDVFVFDVILPQISGFELCERVRKDMRLHTPILLLTTLDDPADILRGAQCGASVYMNKPWHAADLVNVVRTLTVSAGEASPDDAQEASRTRENEYLRSVLAHYSNRSRTDVAGQSHHALRRSEEMFALAAIGANDGLWDWDLDSDAFHTTPRWKEVVGAPADSPAQSTQWLDRVHPLDHERVEAELQAHIAGRLNQFENQHRIMLRDGRSRWVLVRGRSIRGTNGKAHRMAGSLTDISEHKTIEERLLQATGSLNDFLGHFPELFVHLDGAGTVVSRHGGSEVRDALPLLAGLPIDTGLPEAAACRWRRAIGRVRSTGHSTAFSFALAAAGQRLRFHVRLSPAREDHLVAVVSRTVGKKPGRKLLQ